VALPGVNLLGKAFHSGASNLRGASTSTCTTQLDQEYIKDSRVSHSGAVIV
jgi:hypothetical protein